jgi:hypothetical protein
MSKSTFKLERLRAIKQEAVKLRIENRLPTYLIAEKLGVNRGTCHKWLTGYPLTGDERRSHSRPVRRTLVGKRYGRLKVVELVHVYNPESSTPHVNNYRCICDCGTTIVRPYGNLYSGNTRSCGCLSMELKRARKLSDEEIRIHLMIQYYKRNAKIAHKEWKLTESQFKSIVIQPCHYCGASAPELQNYKKPSSRGHRVSGYNGVDRVDSLQGYYLTNVVPCCKICNQAKNAQTLEEFKGWVQRVHQHLRLGVNGEHP